MRLPIVWDTRLSNIFRAQNTREENWCNKLIPKGVWND